MQENVSNLLSEARSALRFRWYGLTVAWIAALLGWAWVMSQPDVYEANARVYVNTTSVLERVLGNQINVLEGDSQINYIRQALLGRDQLQTVIDEVGLGGSGEISRERREGLLLRLRQAISIDAINGAPIRNIRQEDNTYSISYEHSDRDTATAVVSTLLDAFVRDSLGESRRSGESAEQFLEARVTEYEQRLGVAEEALANFKRANADKLPGAEGDYFARLQTATDDLATARRDLRQLESRRLRLVQQLDEQAAIVTGSEDSLEDAPANSLDGRIRETQTQLDLALLQYTDKHPDVVALRETLDYLKKQREERLEALGLQGIDVELFSLDANPVYQALQIELNTTEVEIAALSADIEDKSAEVNRLEGLIEELPEVEAQLAQLNRDYEVVYEQYLALVRSRETQELTLKASDTDHIDFRIIDPPFASLAPTGPPRVALYSAVLMAAIFAGVALSYLCSRIWPVFGRSQALSSTVGLPVLGTVSHAWQARHRIRVRAATRSFLTAFAALLVVYGGLLGAEALGLGIQNILPSNVS